MRLINVRLAFPAIFEPKAVGDGAPRYSAAFPIKPGSEHAKQITAAIASVAAGKWGPKANAVLADLKAKGKVAYKEQPLSKDGEVYAGFEGMHTLNAGNAKRVTVVDRDLTPLTAADGKPYAGCYVVASVDFWAQDNTFGKRVNCTLGGIQFYGDGDAFGSSVAVDQFEDLSVEAMV